MVLLVRTQGIIWGRQDGGGLGHKSVAWGWGVSGDGWQKMASDLQASIVSAVDKGALTLTDLCILTTSHTNASLATQNRRGERWILLVLNRRGTMWKNVTAVICSHWKANFHSYCNLFNLFQKHSGQSQANWLSSLKGPQWHFEFYVLVFFAHTHYNAVKSSGTLVLEKWLISITKRSSFKPMATCCFKLAHYLALFITHWLQWG